MKNKEKRFEYKGFKCFAIKPFEMYPNNTNGYIGYKDVTCNLEVLRKAFESYEEITYEENDIFGFDTFHYYNMDYGDCDFTYTVPQIKKIIDKYFVMIQDLRE